MGESVVTINPGLQSMMEASQQSTNLIASSDNNGIVDLWDMRLQRSHACYQLGVNTASEEKSYSTFERCPVLCHSIPDYNLIAAVRLLPSSPHVLTLTDLASGEQRFALPLQRDVRPLAISFHPIQRTFGVIAQTGNDYCLLLYNNPVRCEE